MREQLSNTAASVDVVGGRSAGQQIVDVDHAGCGQKYRHGTQDDGQNQVEQEDSERKEEAELEGRACANPDVVRCCDAVGIAHVPTLPS